MFFHISVIRITWRLILLISTVGLVWASNLEIFIFTNTSKMIIMISVKH